jgi:hypothetical protein
MIFLNQIKIGSKGHYLFLGGFYTTKNSKNTKKDCMQSIIIFVSFVLFVVIKFL